MPASFNGTFQMSYEVRGELYPWWEKIFLGRSKGTYYVALVGFILLPFAFYSLVSIVILSSIKKCKYSNKAKKSPSMKTPDV